MGGRGSFAAGNPVAYTYETVDFIEGVKVLEKLDKMPSRGLPDEAHSASAYILLNKEGKFRMYREYDNNHYLRFEISYHPEPKLTGNRHEYVLHYHTFKPNSEREMGGRISETENSEIYNEYKKYLKRYGL